MRLYCVTFSWLSFVLLSEGMTKCSRIRASKSSSRCLLKKYQYFIRCFSLEMITGFTEESRSVVLTSEQNNMDKCEFMFLTGWIFLMIVVTIFPLVKDHHWVPLTNNLAFVSLLKIILHGMDTLHVLCIFMVPREIILFWIMNKDKILICSQGILKHNEQSAMKYTYLSSGTTIRPKGPLLLMKYQTITLIPRGWTFFILDFAWLTMDFLTMWISGKTRIITLLCFSVIIITLYLPKLLPPVQWRLV